VQENIHVCFCQKFSYWGKHEERDPEPGLEDRRLRYFNPESGALTTMEGKDEKPATNRTALYKYYCSEEDVDFSEEAILWKSCSKY